jgi:hypothetical protein
LRAALLPPVPSLAALLGACGSSPAPARLQAYQSVQGAPPVDLLVDGTFRAGSIGYPGRSGYQDVAAGTHRVQLVATTGGAVLVELAVTVAEGESRSVLAPGSTTGIPSVAGTALADDDAPPPSGQARLRVVHGSAALSGATLSGTLRLEGTTGPAAPTVTAPFRGGAYLQAGAAGRYRLALADATTGAVVGDFPTGPLAAGSVVTALASDAPPGSLTPAVVSYFTDVP